MAIDNKNTVLNAPSKGNVPALRSLRMNGYLHLYMITWRKIKNVIEMTNLIKEMYYLFQVIMALLIRFNS